MVKTAIIGAATPAGGELARILVNHPEVDSITPFQPELNRHKVSNVHKGLIGEADIAFTDRLNPAELDAVFICEAGEVSDFVVGHLSEYPQLRIIDMSRRYTASPDGEAFVYGVPEINRKPLVRGARYATVPAPVETAVLVSLFPLAINGKLAGNIRVEVSGNVTDDFADSARRITAVLREVQPDFDGDVQIIRTAKSSNHGLRTDLKLPLPLDLEDVNALYDGIYDDHSFTWFLNRSLDLAEVEGTNKCLISLTRPDDEMLRVEAIIDPSLRGGAGEAVHIMNLLFGLHEKVGLTFKASHAYVAE